LSIGNAASGGLALGKLERFENLGGLVGVGHVGLSPAA
jgi:hypothetical protein